MIPVLLILIPLLTGLVTFFIKDAKAAKNWTLFSSVITLGVAITAVCCCSSALTFDATWLPDLGSRLLYRQMEWVKMLCLLTAVSFPLIFAAVYKNTYKHANAFYGLMLLSQAGLIGVFLAADALVFYFFWELALIPVYFLCSLWGGEKRIAVTFKFFIYTFIRFAAHAGRHLIHVLPDS